MHTFIVYFFAERPLKQVCNIRELRRRFFWTAAYQYYQRTAAHTIKSAQSSSLATVPGLIGQENPDKFATYCVRLKAKPRIDFEKLRFRVRSPESFMGSKPRRSAERRAPYSPTLCSNTLVLLPMRRCRRHPSRRGRTSHY